MPPGQPQLPGLGGARRNRRRKHATTAGLIPYNVNTPSRPPAFLGRSGQQVRDDLTMLKGNHLFGFGGAYQRNFDYHSRTDNGAGVNDQVSYLSTSNAGFNWTSPSIQYIPTAVPSAQYSS